MKIKFKLNHVDVVADTSLSKRLLDVIREDFNLTGTKEGCAEGECGACLVYVDDVLVNSCLVPMANVVDRHVLTIEAIAKSGAYKKIENAFIKAGAVQCGYCTPGMVLAVHELLKNASNPTLEEVKEGLSGNLCRCTGYQSIFDAVQMLIEGGYLNV